MKFQAIFYVFLFFGVAFAQNEVEEGEETSAEVPKPKPTGVRVQPEAVERPLSYPTGNRVLELAGTGRCLTITNTFNIVMEKCNWRVEDPSVGSVFKFIKSNRGGYMMRWRDKIPPNAIEGCLLDKIPEGAVSSSEDTEVRAEVGAEVVNLSACDSRLDDQNWLFVQVEESKYQIRKFPDGKCLGVDEDAPQMVTCDKADSDQLWNICRDAPTRVCDN